MTAKSRTSRRRKPNTHQAAGLRVEPLEARDLPSTLTWPGLQQPQAEVEPNDTLDAAPSLGDLSVSGRAGVVGSVGNGPEGASDVDWYRFTLDRPARVNLATLDRPAGSPLVSVLSLYNSDNPFDFSDVFDPLHHRLLAQADGSAQGGDASLSRDLAAGTYYVAVSGSGNCYFNPFLAGSGLPGSTGPYGLLVAATDLGLAPGAGPVVLASDPANGSVSQSSPFVLRLDLSAALDPTTLQPGVNVRLTYNPHGTFGDGNDQPVNLAGVHFSSVADELQLTPAAPLPPGSYKVFLAGNRGGAAPALAGTNQAFLGSDAAHPLGQDFSMTFQVGASAGVSHDVPATALELGKVSTMNFVQTTGAIGNSSLYNPANPDPNSSNPASQVDLYHFQVTGAGTYAFVGELFTGRIGSPLDAGLSLFQRSPSDGKLHLLASNQGTFNTTVDTNGNQPLYLDPVLYAGLTAGDYYLAVSSDGNVPNGPLGLLPGTQGIFDPNHAHSGQNGFTTGNYVLDLGLQPAPTPPQVVSVSVAQGSTLSAPPTQFVVQFDKPVNLAQLALTAFQQTSQNTVAAVYVLGSDGKHYFPRLVSYDPDTYQATFLMLDALPNGASALHLSGPDGLDGLASAPLAGNDPSGDYVVPFTVNGPQRGTAGDPLLWTDNHANSNPNHPQVLGELFPRELQTGVSIQGTISGSARTPGTDQDYYQFQISESQDYHFGLYGSNLPAGFQLTLLDASGNPLQVQPGGQPGVTHAFLQPGTYLLEVGGPFQVADLGKSYSVKITLLGAPENPTPLTVGAAPILRIRLGDTSPPQTTPPPTSPPAPPMVVTPPSPGPSSGDPSAPSQVTGPTGDKPGNTDPGRGVLPVGNGGNTGNGPVAAVGQVPSAQLPSVASTPSGVLASLRAGPVGGVTSPNAGPIPDRVLVQAPTVPFNDGVVQVALLTQSSGILVDGEFLAPVGNLVGAILDNFSRSMGEVLKGVWGSGDDRPENPESLVVEGLPLGMPLPGMGMVEDFFRLLGPLYEKFQGGLLGPGRWLNGLGLPFLQADPPDFGTDFGEDDLDVRVAPTGEGETNGAGKVMAGSLLVVGVLAQGDAARRKRERRWSAGNLPRLAHPR